MKIFPALLLYVLFFIPCLGLAQEFTVKGKVFDSGTGQPLAFVNILMNDGQQGGTSDIDGAFELKSNEPVEILKFSYVGYYPQTWYAGEGRTDKLRIGLERLSVELREVQIFPGINPAHRIINNVIDNRDKNDPEKLKSFSYTSYDKMIFTIEKADSLRQIDTTFLSSGEKELVDFISDKNIFIMETVSERKFLHPDRNYENVIATKVSGFKDPIFVFLISQIQSTSFYNEMIRIANMNYVNPISKGSTRKYYFPIEDTTY